MERPAGLSTMSLLTKDIQLSDIAKQHGRESEYMKGLELQIIGLQD